MQGNYIEHPNARTRLLNMMAKRGYTSISQLLNDPNITLLKNYKVTAMLMLEEEKKGVYYEN
jgi:hypothetical protein